MKNYKIWKDDDGIIRLAILGSYEKQDAQATISEIIDGLKENSQEKILIDLSGAKKTTAGARRIIVKAIEAEPPIFKKTALLGAGVANRVMANFIIKASGKEKKVKYFESEEEALGWLKE